MQKREPYVRKHVHRWKLVLRKEAVLGGVNWFGDPVEPEPMQLARECDDCGLTQQTLVHDESILVPGYEAVADLPWQDEI